MSGRRAKAARRQAVLETEIAVRAYVPRTRPWHAVHVPPPPEQVLVLDTETLVDAGQALLFGSARVYRASGRLVREMLIHADDLGPGDLAILRDYVATHAAEGGGRLRLLSRRDFLRQVFWPIAYKARALVVGFNLPFDLSRLAYGWRPARNGGFTLRLFESVDATGRVWPDQYRPEITVKSLGSKRNFISFTTPARLDADLRDGGKGYRGRFLDLHTLAYAFTDHSLSLNAAAEEFGLEGRKDEVDEHGLIRPEYIDYNRQDVRLTWELFLALVAEWDRHPIELAPEQAYSPAAISKAYLRAAGITPPIERSDVSVARLGQASTAYYGGRAECHIRRVPIPIRYLDFASMYPTVFALLHLWDWVVAERLTAIDATDDARALLAGLDRDALHDPTKWPALAGLFCRVRPSGDLLPVRARYGAAGPGDPRGAVGSQAWTIGLNHLQADHDLWYTLADLLVAKLLNGKAPEVLEAFRVRPVGRLAGLLPVRLRGTIAVDPATDDLFRVSTEERARVKADGTLPAQERARLGQFLKTFANGGAYGIFAEFRQLDPVPGGREVAVHGLWPISARVSTPEEPGAYCFPPLAATITGTARLLLALLQADVEARGGTHVACDTDSLLIVASETGGLVACPGGSDLFGDGREAVRALSWADVDEVVDGLAALSPYAPGTVPGLLKLEPENFALDDPRRPVELWAVATSAKRYSEYEQTKRGIVVRKASEHGLGLYRAPMPRRAGWKTTWREWVDVVWRRIIAEAEGADPAAPPDWFALPAVSHLPVSSPAVLVPFRALNAGHAYAQQIKPFGFLTLGHADPLLLPPGARGAVTPVAPFTRDAAALLGLPWRDRRDGRVLQVTTRPGGQLGKVRLSTLGDVVADYRLHPETKSGDPRGGLGRRGSIGLLPRLTVRAIGLPLHIGKESNRLEEVQDGLVTDPDEVYVTYRDERAEWAQALPALLRLRDEKGWRYLAEASGLSERALRYALNGGKVPHSEARRHLLDVIARASIRSGP
jgi:hypothetical protein